jgi:hypothetical protein
MGDSMCEAPQPGEGPGDEDEGEVGEGVWVLSN